jgi:CDP-diacylglycerol--glycerol-3-phosphate 3-phosphatidyltransferase
LAEEDLPVNVEKPVTKPKTFTDFLRGAFKWLLDPLGAFFNRIGLTPNAMTLLGLAGNFVGAIFIAQGNLTLGGLMVLIMTPIDALDGTMARLRGEASDWGAFVDSVSDRYSELAILGGVLYYFAAQGQALGAIVTFAAAAGSVLVSYTKARADSYKFDANVGILTRVERYLVLAPLLLFNQPIIAVWIMAILANITALQRIMRVRAQAHARMKKIE